MPTTTITPDPINTPFSNPTPTPTDPLFPFYRQQQEDSLAKSRRTETDSRVERNINPHPLPLPLSSEPTRLTFGVELEFNIAYLLPSGRIYRDSELEPDLPHTLNPDPEDPRIVRGIARTELKGVGDIKAQIRAYNKRRSEVYRHIRNTLRKAGLSCRATGDRGRKAEDWSISGDGSVEPLTTESAENYNWMDVEIVSPPFYDHEDSRRQVVAVCEILTSTYRINSKGNHSCGLHVHVSSRVAFNQFSQASPTEFPYGFSGYHPRHLASLMACLWVFEDRIQLIHPEHRRAGHHDAIYCQSLATESWLSEACDFPKEGWRRRGLVSLLSARDDNTCQEICFLTRSSCERLSYNTEQLAHGEGIRTVEFRSHEGTVQAEEVFRWLKVCIALVKFVIKVDEQALDRFLQRHVDDALEDYTVIDLLKAIGSPDEAEYYQKKMRERDVAEEEEWDTQRDL